MLVYFFNGNKTSVFSYRVPWNVMHYSHKIIWNNYLVKQYICWYLVFVVFLYLYYLFTFYLMPVMEYTLSYRDNCGDWVKICTGLITPKGWTRYTREQSDFEFQGLLNYSFLLELDWWTYQLWFYALPIDQEYDPKSLYEMFITSQYYMWSFGRFGKRNIVI